MAPAAQRCLPLFGLPPEEPVAAPARAVVVAPAAEPEPERYLHPIRIKRHGTAHAFNRGCRCALCEPAMRAYRRRAKAGPAAVQEPLLTYRDTRRTDLMRPRSLFPGEAVTRAERKEIRTAMRRLARLKVLQPRSREECRNGPRPCPWVSCADHLALTVNSHGSLKNWWPSPDGGVDLDAMPETCGRDLEEWAERRGGMYLSEIARFLRLSEEGVRRVEQAALEKLGPVAAEMLGLDEAPDRARMLLELHRKLKAADAAEKARTAGATQHEDESE